MQQDKFGELREGLMRRNPLPVLVLGHIDAQSDRILAQFMVSPQTSAGCGLQTI